MHPEIGSCWDARNQQIVQHIYFSAVLLVATIKRIVILKTRCIGGIICDQMIVGYILDEYCTMTLTFGVRNSEAGPDAR
jgi:hypothetical protein